MDNKQDLNTKPLTRPKRRWLSLSLRSLLLLVAVIAVFLAIVVNNAHRQKRAVEKIQALGGSVQYDFQWTDDSSRIAAWLRSTIGNDFVSNVVSAHVGRKNVTDQDLAEIAELRALERLDLSETRITDDGMVHLKGLSRLRILCLNHTRVGDEGLAALRGLKQLQWLELSDTNITDAGLVNLKAMSNLEALWLNGNRIADDGLAHLAALGKLRSIALRNTLVSDVGLPQLLKIPALQSLDLSESQITQNDADKVRAAYARIGLLGP